MKISESKLFEVLQRSFGLPSFRAGQLEAIKNLLDTGNLLCIHPTGFGKSLLYQLPAVLLDGVTLVISPLLALMRDQQIQLENRFGIRSASINTDQSDEENFSARKRALLGDVRILFVAPEQLSNLDSLEFLRQLPIRLIVIDEAHCISTWGHDFRPSYRQILHFIKSVHEEHPQVKILGLTATANKAAEEDIRKQLSIGNRPLEVLRKSMDRPNIKLSVFSAPSLPKKLLACQQMLEQLSGCGLIYCSTRENTELVAAFLKTRGISAAAYHAGMDSECKKRLQKEFIEDKYKVISATNALGMGIDKSNLRYIIHFDVPGSITAYYQEVGRCGRDGLDAHGILLYDPADKRVQEYFIESSQPTSEDFAKVMSAIANAAVPLNLFGIKNLTGLHPTRVTTVLAELTEQGFIEKIKQGTQQVYIKAKMQGKPDLSRYINQFSVKHQELRQMMNYAKSSSLCLMEFLRKALGDVSTKRCGHCSVCQTTILSYTEEAKALEEIQDWLDGQVVEIGGGKTHKISFGIALLDGKKRGPLFVSFMQQRAERSPGLGMPDELVSMLKLQLNKLVKSKKIGGIVLLPSRTWGARNAIGTMLGKYLNLPVYYDYLVWDEVPEARQGFLLNNDQRKKNVSGKMGLASRCNLPNAHILLVDDYIGSGSTINEAARALRKEAKFAYDIIPVTIAEVKWKLGAPGMI